MFITVTTVFADNASFIWLDQDSADNASFIWLDQDSADNHCLPGKSIFDDDGFDDPSSFLSEGELFYLVWLVPVLHLIITEDQSVLGISTSWLPLIWLGSLYDYWFFERSIIRYFEGEYGCSPAGDPEFIYAFPVSDGGGEKEEAGGGASDTNKCQSEGGRATSYSGAGTKRPLSKKGGGANRDEDDTEKGSDPKLKKRKNLSRLLVKAIKGGCHQEVVSLLDQGADPNEPWEQSHPMIVAVRKKPSTESSQILETLIKRGGDCLVYVGSSNNVFSLIFSKRWDVSKNVREAALTSLSTRNIALDSLVYDGKPFLHFLVSRPKDPFALSESAVEMLLENGMNVDVPLSSGRCAASNKTPLLKILEVINNTEERDKAVPIVRLLIHYHARLWLDSSWYSPFCMLLRKQWDNCEVRGEVILSMRRNGVDFNCLSVGGQSLLMHIVRDQKVSVQSFKQLVYSGLYPLFLKSERPLLDLYCGNTEVKALIKSTDARLKFCLQFLCMTVLFQNLHSRSDFSLLPVALPIRSGFGSIYFSGDECETIEESVSD